jgi:hypothetical protein
MAECLHQAHVQKTRSSRSVSYAAETARPLRRKHAMVHRHPTLYWILGLVFLCSTLVLLFLSAAPAWPSATRAALLLLSAFPLILSLSYFYLGNQEERGY